MKLEPYLFVEEAWSPPHLEAMRKVYRVKCVNELRVEVLRRSGGLKVKFDRATTFRAIFSGARTLALFPNMNDLMPCIDSGSVRASWERVGGHLQRAIEHEQRAAERQERAIERKNRADEVKQDREHHAA